MDIQDIYIDTLLRDKRLIYLVLISRYSVLIFNILISYFNILDIIRTKMDIQDNNLDN